MTKFHAIMIGECGEEFGVTVEATSHDAAWDQLDEDYPESSCIQLLSCDEQNARERDIYLSTSEGDY